MTKNEFISCMTMLGYELIKHTNCGEYKIHHNQIQYTVILNTKRISIAFNEPDLSTVIELGPNKLRTNPISKYKKIETNFEQGYRCLMKILNTDE